MFMVLAKYSTLRRERTFVTLSITLFSEPKSKLQYIIPPDMPTLGAQACLVLDYKGKARD